MRQAPDGDADAWVARERGRLVGDLQECCRIPSISAEGGPAMQEMADWLTARLLPLLDDVRQVPVAGAAPAIIGRVEGTGPGSVLLYSHYDVQPAEPLDAWRVPPFAAELVDGAIVARGACDDKADVMARLHAIEALRAGGRRPPCTLIWLSEGAEETGSTGFGELLASEADELRADACLWESYLRRDDGRPEIGFGCRGLVYVELTLRRLRADQHSAFASVFRSAARDLTRALATLTDAQGRVAIAGFHDDVVALDPAAAEAVAGIDPPPAEDVALPGSDPYLDPDAAELRRRLIMEPTANIAGLAAGHLGDGPKTVLPAAARAKIDFRIVPDQRPERVVELLREHLDARGFGDVEIDVLHAVPAARSPLDTPLGAAVTQAARERFGEPLRYPFVPGAGPVHLLTGALGIPAVMPPGSTRMASGIHAPDEHVRIDDYLAHVAFTIRTLELMGRSGVRPA